MEEVLWSVDEKFAFPAIGSANDVELIRVTPQWELKKDSTSVRLVGVYHIAANLAFDPAITVARTPDTIEIEEVDFDGNKGYFEYALPFEVNLPDNVDEPKLAVRNVQTAFDGSSFVLNWDVACHYAKLQPVTATIKEEVLEKPLVEEILVEASKLESSSSRNVVTSAPMIWDLTDNYTVMEIKLNQVIRE